MVFGTILETFWDPGDGKRALARLKLQGMAARPFGGGGLGGGLSARLGRVMDLGLDLGFLFGTSFEARCRSKWPRLASCSASFLSPLRAWIWSPSGLGFGAPRASLLDTFY